MSWKLRHIAHLFIHEVVATPTTVDGFGDRTLGTPITLAAYVKDSVERITQPGGQEVVSSRKVITSGYHAITPLHTLALTGFPEPNSGLEPLHIKRVDDVDSGTPISQVIRV